MAIINQRWPLDLRPETCTFGRTRNDILQRSPRTRQTNVIRQGRPLWRADLSWTLPNTDKLAKLRYWLESLEGFVGSVQVWDFASPFPYGVPNLTTDLQKTLFWTYLGNRAPFTWQGIPSHWLSGATAALRAQNLAGATTVNLKGLEPGKIVAIQGQYIQIGRRLYLVADGASSNGLGNADVLIAPALIETLPVDTEVRLVEAGCEMHLASQDWDSNARAGAGMITISATFIETVENFS